MPATIPPLPTRQVHLDFHTSPFIRDVGVDFDARDFAKTFQAAHVNSVTLFAKCHHGHLYYNTKHPARHPGLKKGFDLLAQQVEALHRVGIRTPIYLSVLCDEYAADEHPEWIAREPDGKPVGAGPLAPGWQILDMASPYQDYLAEQTAEVLKLFKPVDGLFFDMCWDQPSLGNYAVEAMLKRNLNPEIEADRDKYAHELSIQYMKRFHDMVRASSRQGTVYFNGRPYWAMRDDLPAQTQVEIEALPTGGWGYLYFPKNIRFARTLGKPCMGMTARFHKSWADFGGLKPYPALEYETSQMVSLGAACSVGDQLHPRGVLDKAVYQMIGKAYARIEAREPWTIDAQPVAQIGVFQIPAGTRVNEGLSGADEGAARMMMQLKHQFDMIDAKSDLAKYEMLILPDRVALGSDLLKRLSAFIKRGGALLASGFSGISEDGKSLLLPELPIKPAGISEYQTTYIRFGKEVADNVPPTDHVMYERGLRVTPARGGKSVARVVEPYFDRSWRHFSSHFQTPADKLSRFSAAVVKGSVGYIAYPIFSAFHQHGNLPFKLLVRNLIDLLLPEPFLRIAAPSGTEGTMMKQKNRTIVHVLHYTPQRRTAKLDLLEEIVPIFDVPLSVKLPKAPKRVYLAPQKLPIPFEYLRGRANLRVPRVDGHAMVVFE
jgi:Hypothetical glycosyl hydrolase 6/Beta-galactosidase trimerisation domain